jgi:hypothetical protein
MILEAKWDLDRYRILKDKHLNYQYIHYVCDWAI